jgi:hypothetical protein
MATIYRVLMQLINCRADTHSFEHTAQALLPHRILRKQDASGLVTVRSQLRFASSAW